MVIVLWYFLTVFIGCQQNKFCWRKTVKSHLDSWLLSERWGRDVRLWAEAIVQILFKVWHGSRSITESEDLVVCGLLLVPNLKWEKWAKAWMSEESLADQTLLSATPFCEIQCSLLQPALISCYTDLISPLGSIKLELILSFRSTTLCLMSVLKSHTLLFSC